MDKEFRNAPIAYYVLNTLLLTLQVLHVYWWILIWRMAVRQIQSAGKISEDVRSGKPQVLIEISSTEVVNSVNILRLSYTDINSTKIMPKKIASAAVLLTSLIAEQLQICFFLQLKFSKFGGVKYIVGKIFPTPFQRYIKHPQFHTLIVAKPKKQLCSHLTTTDQTGQKNRSRNQLRFFLA